MPPFATTMGILKPQVPGGAAYQNELLAQAFGRLPVERRSDLLALVHCAQRTLADQSTLGSQVAEIVTTLPAIDSTMWQWCSRAMSQTCVHAAERRRRQSREGRSASCTAAVYSTSWAAVPAFSDLQAPQTLGRRPTPGVSCRRAAPSALSASACLLGHRRRAHEFGDNVFSFW